MTSQTAKYVEQIGINLSFSDNFRVEDIPDDAVIHLLDNIENKL